MSHINAPVTLCGKMSLFQSSLFKLYRINIRHMKDNQQMVILKYDIFLLLNTTEKQLLYNYSYPFFAD